MSAIIIGTQIPLYVAQGPAAAGVTVKVMNANLRKGTADAEAVVASARNNADVLAVEELTSASLERLTAAGLDQTFPHRYVVARPGADGMGVWSRYPLTATHLRHDMHVPLIVTAVEIPGLAIAPTVAVAHPRNPWRGREWTADIEGLSRTLIHLRRSTRAAVIVAGDLNSTYDMRAFRDLLRDGYRDAAEQAGTAWSPTFPAGLLIPPVLTIDHVLTLRCTATAAMTITIAGSDHRALTTTVVIP
jgi:endonuclease/exonuclease/phosphatase (EEP) superfamily protein YafD